MKQAVMTKPGEIEIWDVSVGEPGRNEVLLKVLRIGICGSDIHVWHGKHPYTAYPVVQGHEVSCMVEKIGTGVKNFQKGDKVTVMPQVVCGKCLQCRTGRYNICDELKVMGFQTTGLASEYFIVNEKTLIKLPDTLSFETGAFIEPLAVAVHALKRNSIDFNNSKILVLGAGPIGNLIGQTAKALGAAKVIITDICDFRLDIAKKSGIDICVNTRHIELAWLLEKEFGDDKADLILECVGATESLGQAVTLARKGSEIIIVGVFGEKACVDMGLIQDREIKIIGSLMYTKDDYEMAVSLANEAKINFVPLITDVFDFDDYSKAYEYIDKAKERAMKVMIKV